MTTYIALFEYEQGKQGFSVVFPDFPGLVSAGDTYEDALQMAHEALAGHIEVLQDYNEQIPEARTIEQIERTWGDWREWEDNYTFLVVPITAFSRNKKTKVNRALEHSFG